jgi:hypothetical protein
MAIDTLGYAKYLEGHGFTRGQAEAQAVAADRYLFPQLATKADLSDLKLSIKADLADLKTWLVTSIVPTLLAVAGLSITIAKLI